MSLHEIVLRETKPEIEWADDRRRAIRHKIGVYLSAGASAVVVVDGRRRTIAVHDADGARVFGRGDSLTHRALPGLSLDVSALFERASR